MKTRTLLVSVLMFVSILFTACAPAATPPVPTVKPLGEHVIAEWKVRGSSQWVRMVRSGSTWMMPINWDA